MTRLQMSRLSDEGEVLASSIGTGFLWKHDDKSYLITNWHNVTGLNPDTNKLMYGWYPNSIDFNVYREEHNFGKVAIAGKTAMSLKLYDAADGPVWIEHLLGRHVDCVALPLNVESSTVIHTNDYHFDPRLKAYVGMDCIIVGYPKGLSADRETPIWKRASIASEPFLDFEGKPLVLVDTATREGMSGSPAIMRHSGLFAPDSMDGNSLIGTVENFLGIYSGRIGDDPMGVQLGRIWKGHVIDEVIVTGKLGLHPNTVL